MDPGATTIGALMTADPIVVWPDTPMGDVADLLVRYEISGVPVVDWTGYAMGVVSRMDVLRVSRTGTGGHPWRELEARLVMTSPAITVSVDATVTDVAALLEARRIHRVVVVDRDGASAVGIVSAADLVQYLESCDRLGGPVDAPGGIDPPP